MRQLMKRWLLVIVVIAAVLTVDQVSKQVVIDNLLLGETYQLIPALVPYFQITHSFNTGAAFGFLPDASNVFLVIAAVIVVAMLYFYPRIPQHAHLTRVATGMICGGALGNAIDRIRHEHVVDFIHYQIPGLISNVSNLADHAIVLGVILLLVDSWRSERSAKREQAAEESSQDTAGETN
jgi:signal peptidase II